MSKILIIEDDADIGSILTREFSKEGHEVLRAFSGTEGKTLLKESPDLILMDLMLPGLTGEELLPMIPKDIPVIAVSAKSSTDDKVNLLAGGCVDYVTKPFDIKELKARVAVQLRMRQRNDAFITIDTSRHEVRVKGEPVHLTRTEYAIVKILMDQPEQVISKSEILERACEETPDLVESSLKVHISNLRKKLKDAGGKDPIEAVWGIGFKILPFS